MTHRRWLYPEELLAALLPLGLAPRAHTPPTRVREALNALYRFELRRARERLRRGGVERHDYLDLVVSLRKKYWMLTLQPDAWEKICGSGAPDVGS